MRWKVRRLEMPLQPIVRRQAETLRAGKEIQS
jgi:hypothetical protein